MTKLASACAVLILLCFGGNAASRASATLVFACEPNNDLYRAVVAGSGDRPVRADQPAEAVDRAPEGAALLLLADRYPAKRTTVNPDVLRAARAKRLRLFIEFPQSLPGIEFAEPKAATWERVVVSSDAMRGAGLPRLRILTAHGSVVAPPTSGANDARPLLSLARVAGYDTAVYGMPRDSQPVLFRTADGDLVATTKLSHFVTGRFAPGAEWERVWKYILTELDPKGGEPKLAFEPTVRPAYGKDEPLPDDAETRALAAFAKWVDQSGLLVPPKREAAVRDLLTQGVETTDPPAADEPRGDGSLGMLEGFGSHVRHDGHQQRRTPLRADCHAESAMVLALHGAMSGDERGKAVAKNLLDYVYFKSGMHGGVRGDPKHPAFGLIAWGAVSPAWEVANYGDDNARTLLGTMLAAASLNSDAWDEAMLKALYANLRTTGKLGFRGDRIDIPALERHGWRHFHDAETVNYGMNFEAYLWACYLWAYHQTGERAFLDRPRTAIRMTMAAYPRGWRWGDNMERARILLPLAWLVRVEDKPEYRAWIKQVADDLLKDQHACGAIPEHLGGSGAGAGHYVVPPTNEAYGTTETPLIQNNGDPVSDQLYTSGFALIGLHEAAGATNDADLRAAADKLAAYLLRIQVTSKALPYLDGSWMRAFDFGRWDYWASSGDMGWGAWSIEAGWCPAWTAVTLGLRAKGTTLWEMTEGSKIETQNGRVKALLVPSPP